MQVFLSGGQITYHGRGTPLLAWCDIPPTCYFVRILEQCTKPIWKHKSW